MWKPGVMQSSFVLQDPWKQKWEIQILINKASRNIEYLNRHRSFYGCQRYLTMGAQVSWSASPSKWIVLWISSENIFLHFITKQRVNWQHCQRTQYYPAQPVEIQREEKRRQDKDVSIRRKGNWERSIYLVQQSSSWVQRPGDPGTFPNSDRQLFVPHTWEVPFVKCSSK